MDTSWILSTPYTRLTGERYVCVEGEDSALAGPSMQLADFVARMEDIRDHSHDPLVSWSQGRSLDLSDLGVLGETAACAPSLGAALRCLAQGFPILQSGTRARFEINGDKAHFSYRVLDFRIWPRRGDAELTIGLFAALAERCGVPPAAIDAIRFEHDACGRTAALASALRLQPRMGAQDNAICLPVRFLDNPLPGPAQGMAYQTGLQSLARALIDVKRQERLSTRVRHVILEGIGHAAIDQNTIAERLGMSRRSLRRHLEAEGTSFQDLMEECRRACGHAMLTRTRMPLSDIAFALGYSDQSAFSRAFSRWFGESPRELRRTGGREESVIR
ncbi:AraC family transcriptional regulator [Rhodovulum sp. P5]|uniref:AraC-like transcriptional regulator QhpR n=1 Tax=Rhodovulum sp. P5 TaxID=1564506 RepID=UPI0012EC0C0D|nr:AraC family transcriptional regulator [Rhodovulum sp. P5]